MRVKPETLGGSQAELEREIERYVDHDAKLRAFPGRVLVLHALGDWGVKPRHAEMNAAAAGERAKLILFEQGDHNTILTFNLPRIIDEVVGLIQG